MKAMMRLRTVVAVVLSLVAARSTLSMPMAQGEARPSRKIEVVLNPPSAKAARLGRLNPCVAVTPQGDAVVGNAKGLWIVGGGRARPTGGTALGCFTFTPEGLLMGVRGRELLFLDSHARLEPLFHLPGAGMTLVPGYGDSLLLFGHEDKNVWGLYTIRPGRKVSLLLRSPAPISAAAETADRTLVVIDGALFTVGHGAIRPLAGEPKGKLNALAADPSGKAIFASDGSRIFRMEDGRVTVLANGLGGTLRWVRGGLLVFDPRKPLLVRLVGVE